MKCFLVLLYICVGLCCLSERSFAQFSGTISAGLNASSNVDGVDTSSPDRILQPGLTLQYLTQFSPITTYTISFSTAPYLYTQTPDHSYSSTIFDAGGSFYLSNLKAIREESDQLSADAKPAPVAQTRPSSQSGTPPIGSSPPTSSATSASQAQHANESTDSGDSDSSDLSDSLVANTTSALYLVSGALDSMEFKGKNGDALSDRRDSASELISTLADLLDSLTFSASVKEVTLDELKDVRPLLIQILAGSKQQSRVLQLFDDGVKYLNEAKPQSDFMPIQGVVPTPSQPADGAPSTGSLQRPAIPSVKEPVQDEEEESPKAPTYTLISATQPFRTLGAQDFDIAENLTDQSATTFASSLQLPFSYEIRRNQPYYNIYDYNALTLEGTFESSPSEKTSLDLTFDYINSNYQNDSVYTNVEDQLRLGVRTLISHSTSLIFEGILGLKNYSTPLAVAPDSTNKLKKVATVPSSFFQYTFGAGIVHAAGESASFGMLFTISTNPVLRAYVDQLGKLSQRQAASTSDDQYTYNLSRAMVFVQDKIFWGLILAIDVAGEHRKYGSVVKKVTDNITRLSGADRTERSLIANAGLTKEFSFEDARALSLFTDIALTATLGYTTVAAQLPSGAAFPLYTYDDTEVGISLSLSF